MTGTPEKKVQDQSPSVNGVGDIELGEASTIQSLNSHLSFEKVKGECYSQPSTESFINFDLIDVDIAAHCLPKTIRRSMRSSGSAFNIAFSATVC